MHVDHYYQRESGSKVRFRDLTVEMVGAMDKDQTEELSDALIAGFQAGGDPKAWENFDQLTEDAKIILTRAYFEWVDSIVCIAAAMWLD